jgi:hypothetical protein
MSLHCLCDFDSSIIAGGDPMHATIWYGTAAAEPPDVIPLASRILAARLSGIPGFIARVALAEEGGGITAICICEDALCLAAANGVIAYWGSEDRAGPEMSRVPIHR